MIAPNANYWYNSIEKTFGEKVAKAITSLAKGYEGEELANFYKRSKFILTALIIFLIYIVLK